MRDEDSANSRRHATDASREKNEEPTAKESATAEAERNKIKEFVTSLSIEEIKDGNWFAKLLTFSLGQYTKKVDAAYFQEKYKGVPPDAVANQRIKLATRYASIEGGLTATAYTGAIVATIGTAGGASPATVPAATATVMADLAYISQLQLRTAYDLAILYNVPLDLEDPEDLWKLIRVAFAIKGGEFAREGVARVIPAMIRPLVKKFFSGPVLVAAKGLPFVGKYLLQRTVIKVAIPVVGIPIATGMNYWTTLVAGRNAQKIFRNEGRISELAERLLTRSDHPQLLLWVSWLIVNADSTISEDETRLFQFLTRFARERQDVADEKLAAVIDIEPAEVWTMIAATDDDMEDIISASQLVASVDGDINAKEQALLDELKIRCRAE